MKYSVLIASFIFMFSCGTVNEDKNKGENPLQEDHLMSEGTATDPGSRIEWERIRLANPATGQIPANIKKRELEFAQTLPSNYLKTNFTWDQRGPVNVGGRTRTIALDILDENIMMAGGVTGGIWRSTNGGVDWVKVTDPMDSHSITALCQDTRPGHESTWYAGTGEHYGIVSQTTFIARASGNGLLKSTDNGLTWAPLVSTQSNTPETFLENGDMDFVWRIVIDPTDLVNDVVIAAVYNGLYRSTDGGATWTAVLGFSNGATSDYVDLVVSPTGVFYCTMSSDGLDKGVYRSDDGITWTYIVPAGFVSTYGRLAIAINPLDENVLWFFGSTSSTVANGHSIYRYQYLGGDGSGSNGSWDDRSMMLPNQSCYLPEITAEIGLLSTQQSFDVHIAVHPTDTATIYIAGTSIWRNNDAFLHDSTNTWIGGYQCDPLPYNDLNWNLSYPNHHPDQHYISFLPSDPNVLINVNDGGIYKTDSCLKDSVDWIPLNNGYVTTQFYAIAIEPGVATSEMIIGGLQDNGTWFTNTDEFDTTWKYIGSGDGMYCAMTNGRDYYLTSKQRGKLYLKQIDDNGNVLAHERIDPDGATNNYNWANSFKLDPSNDKRIIWNGKNKLWRLNDMTQISVSGDRINKEPNHWEIINESNVGPQSSIISDIEMCESDSDKVWYGTTNGYLYRLDNAYGSSGTPTKVDLQGSNFPSGGYVSSIGVNPFNSDQIIVTFGNYEIPSVFVTADGGVTWTDISGNLEENPDGSGAGPAAFWCEYYPDGTLFVGTSTGLYTTDNIAGAGTVWALEAGIGNVPVDHMDFRTHDGFFVVGTHGQGIFSTHLQPAFVGIDEVEEELSVYPTLVDDQIQINTPLAANQLEVYNLRGQLVSKMTLTNPSLTLNVEHFKAGAYIVVVKSDEKVWTQKVVKR